MPKVVLIQPYYENIWEAIGLGYIASYCKKELPGIDWEFFQGNFDEDEKIIRSSIESDIVGFSCTSPAYPHALRISKEIKKRNPNVHTVFGGWHPTALPHKVISEESVDQIVLGEGEDAFLEILKGNRDAVIQGGKPKFEELPWPDRDLIRNNRTIDLCESMNGKRIASFQGNRVCPVNCSFCSERIITGRYNKTLNPIRSRNAVDLLDEIDYAIDRYNLNYFKFVDATFDISPAYVIEFCQEKIRRENTTEWECLIHASFANEEMFYWLKEAQCNQVNVGCESGSDKILKQIGKGLKVKTITNVFRWAKKYGIERRGFFLLGMPNETKEDLLLTQKLIDNIEPDVVGFTILCPYPGTDHYDPIKHKDVDWEKADEYSNDFWCTKHFTNKELKKIQQQFKDRYDPLLCERQEYKPELGMSNETISSD